MVPSNFRIKILEVRALLCALGIQGLMKLLEIGNIVLLYIPCNKRRDPINAYMFGE